MPCANCISANAIAKNKAMKRFLLCALGHLSLVWAPLAANAVPINITVDASGNLYHGSGIASSSEYAALQGLGSSNNAPEANLAFLNAVIANWNAAKDPDLPAAVEPLMSDVTSFTGNSYTALAGYQYVVLHFGAGKAGGGQVSPGGWWQVWDLNGEGGVFALPTVNENNVGGFSSARYYNSVPSGSSVPDNGATLLLLGGSLGLLGLFGSFVNRGLVAKLD